MKLFFEVTPSMWLERDVLTLGWNQEMQDKPPVPSHSEYRVQPGIIDLDHLELVALKRVTKYSYMPHFRLISPSAAVTNSLYESVYLYPHYISRKPFRNM